MKCIELFKETVHYKKFIIMYHLFRQQGSGVDGKWIHAPHEENETPHEALWGDWRVAVEILFCQVSFSTPQHRGGRG